MSLLPAPQAYELAFAHFESGRWSEVAALCETLLCIYPGDTQILQIHGLAAYHLGQHDLAIETLQQAVRIQPDVANYHINLAVVLDASGRAEEAEAECSRALELEPANPDAHYNRGNARMHRNRWTEAIADYRVALKFRPTNLGAVINLGTALHASGQPEEAIAHFRSSLDLFPENPSILCQWGSILFSEGRLDEAAEKYCTVLAGDPQNWLASNNLGNTLMALGAIESAIAAYRRCLAINPQSAEVHSNLIFALHFDPNAEPDVIRIELNRWQQQHAVPRRAHWHPHENDRTPDRRLRIGYVSPDFRDHIVGRVLLPILEAHDRKQFEIFCYGTTAADPATPRFRAAVDHWRDAAPWTEERLTECIRADRIDVLVDLSLHTAFNSLPAFARKPAPVQVSWLGYPGTSGLESIDYDLTDRFLTPSSALSREGHPRPFFLESYWSFTQPDDSPPITPLPARERGDVTFACSNQFSRINAHTLDLWGRILRSVEGSRLVLVCAEGRPRENLRADLSRRGVITERVDFTIKTPRPSFLDRLRELDIALDTFPYNGPTTSLDALWMGVPVVSLAGETTISRGGLSVLSQIGLPELVARNADDYVKIAVDLAHDLDRLATLRAGLRARLQSSPLMDLQRFTGNLEAAYREMWRRWCAG